MVNALRLLALSLACAALPAQAQQIAFEPVLGDEDAIVTQTTQAGTAGRLIAPRRAGAPGWPLAYARNLLEVVEAADADGLDPTDYAPGALRAAIAEGPGPALDRVARASFTAFAGDMLLGRTPAAARRGYLMEDADAAALDIERLIEQALASGDVAATLAALAPTHPDYQRLRAALPAASGARRASIIANLDRWRWLPRDLGGQYVMVNVPEYRARLIVNGQSLASYRTIVGKPGSTATPQMAEMVEGVIFNPTWTVPQSIVVGEGLGRRVLGNPNWARANGYSATRGANGYVSVVQAPGPGNSLGAMKLDMPNEHAIFLHDTPAKTLFARDRRALSHGCVRTEHAMELALTLARLGGAMSAGEAMEIAKTGAYTRVAFEQAVPVYLGYFTMGTDAKGNLASFPDIYGRDAPVLAEIGSGEALARR